MRPLADEFTNLDPGAATIKAELMKSRLLGKKWLFISCLFAIMTIGACTNGESEGNQRPQNILSEEDFIKVLVDFSLSESAATLNIMNLHTVSLDSVSGFNPLLEHHVRRSQFDSTIRYYSYNPEDYRRIYDSVLTRLSDMQTARSKPVRDSTAK